MEFDEPSQNTRHDAGDAVELARKSTAPLSSGVKLLRALAAIAETTEPFRVSDLARELGSSRSEVHRQVVTLQVAGWLDKRVDGRYALTMKAAHLGHAAMSHAPPFDRASGMISELAERVGEVASLAVLDGDAMRILQRAEPGRALRVTLAIGARMNLWTSASGRALLAHAAPGTIRRLTVAGVRLPSPGDLAAIRARGYAHSVDEAPDDVVALAVPIGPDPTEAVAALSVVGPRHRISVDRCVAELKRTAVEINNLLRTSGPLGGAGVLA